MTYKLIGVARARWRAAHPPRRRGLYNGNCPKAPSISPRGSRPQMARSNPERRSSETQSTGLDNFSEGGAGELQSRVRGVELHHQPTD